MIRAIVSIGAAAAVALPGAGWQRLPAAPVTVDAGRTAVWTGREMIVYGVHRVAPDGTFVGATNVADAYDPSTGTWRRLADPPGPAEFLGNVRTVWTGRELLVWPSRALDPRTNRWRRLPRVPSGGSGLVVWTGKEMIGWGGGCCGDVVSDGAAYDPRTNTWRKLARSPLAGSQHPTGAWTGRELVILVAGHDPDGKPWPARLARAAAYNPATDTWRRIAVPPAPREGATAVWDGHEVLVVGGARTAPAGRLAPLATVGFAFDPSTNRWRRLPPMAGGRSGAAVVWTGRRLLVWGGSRTANAGPPVFAARALAYDPKTNRWTGFSRGPLSGRLDPAAVWTGHTLVVWGGERPRNPLGTGTAYLADGAAFTGPKHN